MSETLLAKKCATCAEWKSRREFYAAPSNLDGLHGSCKKCHAIKAKKRAEDPAVKARKREVYVAWRKANASDGQIRSAAVVKRS